MEPLHAITLRRPWTYVATHGLQRHLLARVCVARLDGKQVLVHSGPEGDAWLHRHLGRYLGDQLRPDDLELPKSAIVGVATVQLMEHRPGWVLLRDARPLPPTSCRVPKGVDLAPGQAGQPEVLGCWTPGESVQARVRALLSADSTSTTGRSAA